ncbi:hypothetical protein C5167_013685 [Papaver somniferum]|uniref:Uncharacterized protein n=1 Tax=Papaver somniferum TaxID=3469 RepID=A0A4Y7J599_PAPSO|nr:hypothetical protein C5167_013685 [Papaver somniferum]
MLVLLIEPLKSAGFGILRLDATTSAKRRDYVMQKFNNQDSESPIVLLVEFKPSVSGIDLTAQQHPGHTFWSRGWSLQLKSKLWTGYTVLDNKT